MAKSKNDLDFPDNARRAPGKVQTETIQAMRDAKGDRRIAAAKLGLTLHALASRLHVIRSARNAA